MVYSHMQLGEREMRRGFGILLKGLRKAGLEKGRVKLRNLASPTTHLEWAATESMHGLGPEPFFQ